MTSGWLEDTRMYYYTEWHIAAKNGDDAWAQYCKEQFRKYTLQKLIQPYHQHEEELKQFPFINLN